MVSEAELGKELVLIRKDLDLIKNILSEDFELSESAKAALREARSTPESEYIEL